MAAVGLQDCIGWATPSEGASGEESTEGEADPTEFVSPKQRGGKQDTSEKTAHDAFFVGDIFSQFLTQLLHVPGV